MRRFNLLAPEFDHSSEREGYRWRRARLGPALGAEQIRASLYELEHGQRTFPYHFHYGAEEWLFVVAGSPRLRAPEGERVLEAGEVVCFPVGPAGAHQVTGPGTVLIISAARDLDAAEYPDSGKLGVRPPGKVFRGTDSVDYWDGE